MFFPLYVFILIFIFYLLLYTFFVFAMIYHLARFGFKSFGVFFVTFSFLAGSILILWVSFQTFSEIDWRQEVDLFEGLSGARDTRFGL